jgi:hypothetical protein
MRVIPLFIGRYFSIWTVLIISISCGRSSRESILWDNAIWDQCDTNPYIIKLDLPVENFDAGGIIVADVNGDRLLDYIVTKPMHVATYSHNGEKLWVSKIDIRLSVKAENNGLPGLHHPGIQAADVDGDGHCEVIFLTNDGKLHIIEGATGKNKRVVKPTVVPNIENWEVVIVANLRGLGDRDLIFQAYPQSGPNSKRGQKQGRLMAAFRAESPDGLPLWQTDHYWAPAHGTARIADIDLDGRDEVVGVTIIDYDGSFVNKWHYTDKWDMKRDGSFHVDSMFIYDVRPDLPGLEVVILEEGANHISLVNMNQFIWRNHYKHQEPQNAAVGDFDPNRPGLEIWCRSRYNEHQKPFVFDANGNLISFYEMDNVAPSGWTVRGVEEISTIDWTGETSQLAAAKERHKSGDVAIFDPISGKFLQHFKETADRLYVADVSGDWREEIIVLCGNEIHIYHNAKPNPNPNRKRLWAKNHYRRSKMNWNYYSP